MCEIRILCFRNICYEIIQPRYLLLKEFQCNNPYLNKFYLCKVNGFNSQYRLSLLSLIMITLQMVVV